MVGEVTGSGSVELAVDEIKSQVPFNLKLEHVLGKMPRKVFKLNRQKPILENLKLPPAASIYRCLEKVLRLPAVASKRYLTNKVDR